MKKHNKPGRFGIALVLWLVIGAEAVPAFAQCNVHWRAVSPASQPPQRQYHAMAFDYKRGVTVLFGGITIKEIPNSSDALGDTWEFDGKTWTQRFPATVPPPLFAQCMSYDRARGVTVMFGGGITWEWDGENWTQVAPAGGVSPSPRSNASMVYDSSRRVHVLYGGGSDHDYTDTWEYDDSTHTWTLRAASGPPGRFGMAMAYDSARNETMLFGGGASTGRPTSFLNDTWVWNGQAGTWTQRFPAHQPPGRQLHVMAFDAARNVVVLQGGQVETDLILSTSSTWEWDGADWTDKSSAYNFCCALPVSAMVYEGSRQQMLIYDAASNFTYDNPVMTTWVLAAGSGQPVTYADVSNHGAADGSSAHPYPKIQQAANCAIGGSTVSIKTGDYAEGPSYYGKQLNFNAIGGQVYLH